MRHIREMSCHKKSPCTDGLLKDVRGNCSANIRIKVWKDYSYEHIVVNGGTHFQHQPWTLKMKANLTL